jgi:hypothetical protein
MQSKLCAEGRRLDRCYTEKSLEWQLAETLKLVAVDAALRAEWSESAGHADHARRAYEEARNACVEHAIFCQTCGQQVLGSSSEEHPHFLSTNL